MSEERRPALPAVPVAAQRRSTKLRRHPLFETALAYGDMKFDFEAFADAMMADLRPRGPLETTLAARAVSLCWRLNRAQGLESAFLSRSKYSGDYSTPIDESLSNGQDIQMLDGMQRWESSLQRNLISTLDKLRVMQAARNDAQPASKDCEDTSSSRGATPEVQQ